MRVLVGADGRGHRPVVVRSVLQDGLLHGSCAWWAARWSPIRACGRPRDWRARPSACGSEASRYARVRNRPSARIQVPTVEAIVQRLELVEVVVVAARHAAAAQQELRQEGHVEADEDQRAADRAPASRCTCGRTSWATSSGGPPRKRDHGSSPSSRSGSAPRRSRCRAGGRRWTARPGRGRSARRW